MNEAMNIFLQAAKEREHIRPLIQHADLRVCLRCHDQAIQLIMKNGEIVALYHSENSEQTKNEISGSLSAMKQLLEGKERLRVLEQQGELTVAASLRAALLLESIFYLTKARQPLVKIV